MATSDDKENNSQQANRVHRRANNDRERATGTGTGTGTGTRTGSGDGTRNERVAVAEAMRLAAGQLAELLRSEPESVSSVKTTRDGFTADVEVVEIERVPDTTSVMGSYRVQLDPRGNLLGYERTRRYARGQIDQRT